MNIYQKLLAITADLSTVAKNLEVGVGASKYKAVGEADILRAVKPLEQKYGIYSYPLSRTIIESGTLENQTTDKNGNVVVKKNLFERIEVTYRFINTEKPDEFIDIISYGDGIDSQDKSVGKAMTYADKYALMKAYKIITGDDPDQNASEDLKDVNTKKEPLNPKLIEEAASVGIEDLNKVAKYFKHQSVDELTSDELKKAINQKRALMGGTK